MSEQVTVVPAGVNSDGNPVTGDPLTLAATEIAPGNALVRFGSGGDLTDVEFTVYLPLRTQSQGSWVDTATLIADGDHITVRGRTCVASVQVWRSGGRGGVCVLARSRTGKAA